MNNSALGGTWEELQKELFTPEEIAASNLRVALIGELIKARQERGISQKKLEELERGKTADHSPHGEGNYKPTDRHDIKGVGPAGENACNRPAR